MELKINPNIVPITEAEKWTENWQLNNLDRAKAFLIPVDDLLACFEEMGMLKQTGEDTYTLVDRENAQVRAYMANDGLTGPENGFGDKLLMVATKFDGKHYRDIVQDERPETNEELIGSGVFDLTTPCPNECDPDSPLLFNTKG